MLTRRAFVAGAALASLRAGDEPRYRVGITTNTRGGWEKDVFLSFREAHEVGYRYVESFIDYFGAYLDKPAELLQKTDAIGVKFDTVSNGGHMEMHFEDSSKHEKILEEHMRLARFIKRLGCDHLKINTGPRRPTGTTAQDLKNMAAVLDMLGHRMADETGLKFGVHAHMWTQLENRHEIDAIMAFRLDKVLAKDYRGQTVIICGDSDRITPERFAPEMAESFAGSKVATIHGAGHMVFLERPKEFDALVRDHLSKKP